MRVILALLGALIGAAVGQSSILAGAVFGGCVGLAFAELRLLRAMLAKLDQEVARLRRQSNARERGPAAPIPLNAEDLDAASAPAPRQLTAAATSVPAAAPGPAVAPTRLRSADAPARIPDSALVVAIKRFFTGGNTLVQAGVVVLFFGVAFLLRYLAEHSHVSIEIRLSAIAFSGIALLTLGWRLRLRKAGYALALQGGGVGILYLTVFAAMRLYGLLPPLLAFGFLVLIAVLAAALAVLQDSAAFALLSITGGFLAPLLAATGEGSHVVLFSYYAILNSGIAIIAWFKAWRPLNLAGFLFTFAIASAWGALKFQPSDFASTEPFLIFFFLLYVAITVLFTSRQPLKLRGYVDGALVFGTPIAAFGLQSAMLRHEAMALAYTALAMSSLYLLLVFGLKRRGAAAHALLAECFLGLAVAFLTLAIPLALGSRLNSAAWALEGAALVWIGCRQNRRAARGAGTLLMIGAALLLIGEVSYVSGFWRIPVSEVAGVVWVSAACMVSVLNLDRRTTLLSGFERPYAAALFGVGLAAWVSGGLAVLPQLVSASHWMAAALGFLALSAGALSELDRRVQLKRAAPTALQLLPVMVVFFLASLSRAAHPFAAGGSLAWAVAFAILYLLLYRHEGAPRQNSTNTLHTFAAWLLCLILGWEAGWLVSFALAPASPEWAQAARMAPPALALALLPRLASGVRWPFALHREVYFTVVSLGLCVALIAWSLASNVLFEGDAAPLPYLPLLNPLDLAQGLALLTLLRHGLLMRRESSGFKYVRPWVAPALLAATLFVWLNGMLLRSLHHWIGVPLKFDALLASNVVETSLSIFWSVLALLSMLFASRQRSRPAWLTGAALLIVVIIKLFLIDLANVGSIERIVSFVGVGMAMLVVGYFSPLPPRLKES